MERQTYGVGPITIGISMCLLGEKVRFDAGHKKDAFVTDVLGRYFSWVPVCPELEVGMGVPREAVRLVGAAERPALVGVKSGTDWTVPMREYSDRRAAELRALGLCGFILKKDSPSCGMERVRIYDKAGMPAKNGRGIFAAAYMTADPLVPVEEEGRLNDPHLRDNFIVRVFSLHRLRDLMGRKATQGELVRFHTVHKYLLLAHSPKHYASLGRLVAGARSLGGREALSRYAGLFMEGLSVKSTVKKNTNVLDHIMGFLKDRLSDAERRDIRTVIDDYHRELLPLVVPVTLLRHYVEKLSVEYIRDQVYLQPHPKELMLRNHV